MVCVEAEKTAAMAAGNLSRALITNQTYLATIAKNQEFHFTINEDYVTRPGGLASRRASVRSRLPPM
jgi:hypothetical protein